MNVWWVYVLGGLVAWVLLGLVVALGIGRTVRLADRRSPEAALRSAEAPVDVPPTAPRPRREPIPLPNFAVGLAALAVLAETVGLVTSLNGLTGQTARLLSMDAPFSLPRLYVAALFGAAALAAAGGAGVLPGRRTWWLAVAAVAAVFGVVKAGGAVHTAALRALSETVGFPGAVLLSLLAGLAVVTTLWFLSRQDRRDRRRVLGSLTLYLAAAVGISGLSSAFSAAYGSASTLTLTVTYLEEAGEALGAVALLVAVLAGVAPRLVLPAEWVLRRADDEHTLEVTAPTAEPTSQDLPRS